MNYYAKQDLNTHEKVNPAPQTGIKRGRNGGQMSYRLSQGQIVRAMFLALIAGLTAFLGFRLFYEMNFLFSMTLAFLVWWAGFFVFGMLFLFLVRFSAAGQANQTSEISE